MQLRIKATTTAVVLLIAVAWTSSASALVISGTFHLTESVPATATAPGATYTGQYTTVDFDLATAVAGDIVQLSDFSVSGLFGGFVFSDFANTPLAVLGNTNSVVAFSGLAHNPAQQSWLSLGSPFGNPGDSTFSAGAIDSHGLQLIHGHQYVSEPGVFALLGGGLLAMGLVRRRRKHLFN